MLHVLRGAGISDVMAVVARWFGGVKLGSRRSSLWAAMGLYTLQLISRVVPLPNSKGDVRDE